MRIKLIILTAVGITAAGVLLVILITTASAQTGTFPVDLVWKTDTYIPPDFDIKALPASGSRIELFALTPTENPAAIEFTWRREGSLLAGGGTLRKEVGLNTYSLRTGGSLFRFGQEIEVLARNIRTGETGSARVRIPAQEPEVHLYNSASPYPQRIGLEITAAPGEEKMIFARPFYFRVTRPQALSFSWKFDGTNIRNTKNRDILVLSVTPETAPGTRRSFSLRVEDSSRGSQGFAGSNRASISSNLLIIRR